MQYYVVSATGTYPLTGAAPSSDEIIAAINQQFPPGQSTWIGPSPRITRTGTDSSLLLGPVGWSNRPTVTVAWAFSLPQDDPGVAATVATAMQNALTGLGTGGSWHATVAPYDQVLNGPLTFWQSGQDAQTVSRDQFPTFGGPTLPTESPVGPNSTPSVFQQLNPFSPPAPGQTSAVDALTKLLTVAGIVIAGGTVLYLAWPLLSSVRAGASARTRAKARYARANPSRRRRRSARRSAR